MKIRGWIGICLFVTSFLGFGRDATAGICEDGCYIGYTTAMKSCVFACPPLPPQLDACFNACIASKTLDYYQCLFDCRQNGGGGGTVPYLPRFRWDSEVQFFRPGEDIVLSAGLWNEGGFIGDIGSVIQSTFYVMDFDAVPEGGFPPDTPLETMPWVNIGNGDLNWLGDHVREWVIPAAMAPTGYFLRVDFEDAVYGTLVGADFAAIQQCPCVADWGLSNPAMPAGRYGQAAAYYESIDRVAFFGGFDGQNALGDTWFGTGDTWAMQFPAHSPPPRYGAAMVYDRANDRLILHGGYDPAVGYLSDTWALDGDWSLVATNGPPCAWTGMAYDSDAEKIVLYGGATATGRSRDTWEFDGTSWTQITTNSPPGYRSFHAMVYDEVAQRAHMFGGQLPGGVETNSNWAYKNGVWTDLGSGGPSPRRGQQMTYRPGCGTILLFGGEMDGTHYGDLWEYLGYWRQLTPGGTPPTARHLGSLTCMADGGAVLFGGVNGSQYPSDWFRLACGSSPADVSPMTPSLHEGGFELHSNPTYRQTTVMLELPSAGRVSLTAYDASGRLVATIATEDHAAGSHAISWNGTDDRGARLPSGLYFIRLQTQAGVATQRLTLLR